MFFTFNEIYIFFLHQNVFGNAFYQNILKITYDVDGGCYELLTFSSMDAGANGAGADQNDLRRGPCLAAVFLARNRFAVLDKNRQVFFTL